METILRQILGELKEIRADLADARPKPICVSEKMPDMRRKDEVTIYVMPPSAVHGPTTRENIPIGSGGRYEVSASWRFRSFGEAREFFEFMVDAQIKEFQSARARP